MRCRLHPGHPGHRNKYIVGGRASNNNEIENTSNVLICLIMAKLMKANELLDYDFRLLNMYILAKYVRMCWTILRLPNTYVNMR